MVLCSAAICGAGCNSALGGFNWIFQLIIVLLLILIFWWLFRGQQFGFLTGKESPLDILKRRYAAGEITKKEFTKLKKELE